LRNLLHAPRIGLCEPSKEFALVRGQLLNMRLHIEPALPCLALSLTLLSFTLSRLAGSFTLPSLSLPAVATGASKHGAPLCFGHNDSWKSAVALRHK
jgi:hypothetical protein